MRSARILTQLKQKDEIIKRWHENYQDNVSFNLSNTRAVHWSTLVWENEKPAVIKKPAATRK